MTRSPEQAIDSVAFQSANADDPFDAGMCKQRTRMAYLVESDGSNDATEAWGRTKHRIPVSGKDAPRGALLWWTGGSAGHGHVAIADGKGGVWSVDVKRTGYWDHVPFAEIQDWASSLRWAGVSRDIDGKLVVPIPSAPEKPSSGPVALPTLHDLAIALERLAGTSANPTARGEMLHAAQLLDEVSDDNHVKVPTSLDAVRIALKAKSASGDLSALRKRRVHSSIELLRGI